MGLHQESIIWREEEEEEERGEGGFPADSAAPLCLDPRKCKIVGFVVSFNLLLLIAQQLLLLLSFFPFLSGNSDL